MSNDSIFYARLNKSGSCDPAVVDCSQKKWGETLWGTFLQPFSQSKHESVLSFPFVQEVSCASEKFSGARIFYELNSGVHINLLRSAALGIFERKRVDFDLDGFLGGVNPDVVADDDGVDFFDRHQVAASCLRQHAPHS